MEGVITRTQVLAHPLIILEGFGAKVLLRALFAGPRATFLEIVRRSAEEERLGPAAASLLRAVERFVGYECRARDLYRGMAGRLEAFPPVAAFLATLAAHEEGHAIVLSRVRREVRRGRLRREPAADFAREEEFEARLSRFEEEARAGITPSRALEIVEELETSEINVVFDSLSRSVDMRSRARFERFFVLTEQHLACCAEEIRSLRQGSG